MPDNFDSAGRFVFSRLFLANYTADQGFSWEWAASIFAKISTRAAFVRPNNFIQNDGSLQELSQRHGKPKRNIGLKNQICLLLKLDLHPRFLKLKIHQKNRIQKLNRFLFPQQFFCSESKAFVFITRL